MSNIDMRVQDCEKNATHCSLSEVTRSAGNQQNRQSDRQKQSSHSHELIKLEKKHFYFIFWNVLFFTTRFHYLRCLVQMFVHL